MKIFIFHKRELITPHRASAQKVMNELKDQIDSLLDICDECHADISECYKCTKWFLDEEMEFV